MSRQPIIVQATLPRILKLGNALLPFLKNLYLNEPTPTPCTRTEPKLIPIVTTAPDADPVALARLYRQRWPVQENILKDWLLPVGLDTNHGFAKTPVENSEIAKRREALERRMTNIQRWAPKAHERTQRASSLAERLRQETKAHSDALYQRINGYICEHDWGDEREWRLQHKPVVKAMQAEADADLDARWRHYERVRDREDREERKYTRYCLEQCEHFACPGGVGGQGTSDVRAGEQQRPVHDGAEVGAGQSRDVGETHSIFPRPSA